MFFGIPTLRLEEILRTESEMAVGFTANDMCDVLALTMSLWEKKHNEKNWYLGLPKWYIKFVNKYFKWML